MQPKAGMTETPKRKTAPETDPVEAENGKTTPEISLTETSTSKTGGEMVEEKRLTASKTVNKGGQHHGRYLVGARGGAGNAGHY